MKKIFTIIIPFLFASCIKDELPNAEADILKCEILGMPENVLDGISIGNEAVKIWVKSDERDAVKTITLNFTLSEGASIFPTETSQNFEKTDTVSYTITSQDGKWKKKYLVEITSFALFPNKDGNVLFSFEHFEEYPKPTYHLFYELNEATQSKQYIWSSGNAGFGIANATKLPEEYPTSSYANGKTGRGVRLTTTSTGSFGIAAKMPIAAGNLYIGTFDKSKAMSETLKATSFGMSSKLGEPVELRFWYKYQRGAEYKDKNGNVLDKTDNPDIYAVLYEPVIKNGAIEKLNGTNVKTAGNIVLLANLNPEDIVYSDNFETAEYRQLSIPFVKKKEIDPEKLRGGNYFLTIVFSSSAKGDLFEGAIGSTLCIDEIELICK